MAGINLPIISKFDDKGVKQATKAFDGIGSTLGAIGGVLAAAFSIRAISNFTKESITAAEGVAVANARIDQIAKSMNLFGSETQAVADRLKAYAEANELNLATDAEVIKATQAKLLTFRELGLTADETGGAFDRATAAAIDLAAAGFGSAETNAVQLGKALQDPIKGITALTRSGITFTAEEREKIKVLTESGQILEAQNMILGAIETQVGGTAAATATATQKMQLAFDNVKETVGLQLLPVFELFSEEVLKLTPEIEQGLSAVAAELAIIVRDQVLPAFQDFTAWLASPEGTQTVRDLAQAIVDVIKGFFDFVAFIVANRETIVNLAVIIGGFTIAVKLATAATAIHTAALGLMSGATVTATTTTGALGTALRLLPWAAVAIGVASLIQSFADYSNAVYGSKVNTTGLTEEQIKQARRIEDLQRLLGQYRFALENGTEANKQLARDGIARVTAELQAMGIRADIAGGHLRDLNSISLGNLQREVFNASSHLKDLAGVAAQVAGATPPKFEKLGIDIGDNLIKGMQSKTKDVEKAAKDLAKAAVPAGYELVQGPNGPYLERKDFVSGRSDRGVGDFGAASASFLLRQQGLNQAQIDKVLTRSIGGTLDQVNATINSGVTLIDKATNRMIQGNLTSADVAEKVAQGFKVVEKIAAPIEDLEKAIGDLVSGIQGGQTAYLKPMAVGGFVTTPTAALVGEAGPEVVMPLDRFERAIGLGNKEGSSYNISINAGMGSDPVSIGREVVNAIKRYESVSGKVFASA